MQDASKECYDMAKQMDTKSASYAENVAVIPDSYMTQEEALDFISDEDKAALSEEDTPDEDNGKDSSDGGPDSDSNLEDEDHGDEGRAAEPDADESGQREGAREAEAEQRNPVDQQEATEDGEGADGLGEDIEEFVPRYTFKAEDIEARQTKLDSDYAEARKIIDTAFENGEIDDAEFKRRSRQIDDIRFQEQRKIDRDLIKAEISREQTEQVQAQSWDHALARFMAANKEIRSSRSLMGAMQAQINAVGEEYAGKNLSYAKLLDMAKVRVYQDLGIKTAGTDRKAEAVKALVQKRAAKPAIPRTLGEVPADKVSSGKFADLDGLKGLAYEDAIARMTPDELDRWSR